MGGYTGTVRDMTIRTRTISLSTVMWNRLRLGVPRTISRVQ
jgi:hypothetical protein